MAEPTADSPTPAEPAPGVPTRHVATADGLRLAVYEQGPEDAPVVVLVHGYPDNHRVWDGVTEALAGTHRVVRYDVRGSGASDVPAVREGYRIERLVDDLGRVIDAVSPEAPVHLAAHDWGSIQCWDALPDDRLGVRIRSFTSISGPSLDHASLWLRDLRRGPLPRLKQLAASYYIYLFLTPGLPELAARRGVIDRLVEHSESIARPSTAPAGAALERGEKETVNGIELYRANVLTRLLRPRPPKVTLPVQVVVPDSDVHVSPALAAGAPVPHVSDLSVAHLGGNHWVPAQRPEVVASLIGAFVRRTTPDAPASAPSKDTRR